MYCWKSIPLYLVIIQVIPNVLLEKYTFVSCNNPSNIPNVLLEKYTFVSCNNPSNAKCIVGKLYLCVL